MLSNYLFNIRSVSRSAVKCTINKKPPNVLVLSDNNETFKTISHQLELILNSDKHIVYQLKSDSAYVNIFLLNFMDVS